METTRITLEPHPSQVRLARSAVVAACAGLSRDLVEIATLLASELVTNAIRHGRGVVHVAIKHPPSQVCVEVTDAGPGEPREEDPPPTSTRGRGVLLVESLASRWGVHTSRKGKTVWFTLDTD